MRVLIYKRTHVDDPNDGGVFGCCDCMGTVRSRNYDAVIGIGGVSAEPRSHGIAEKVNWIGIGPHKSTKPKLGPRKPLVTFDHFVLFNHHGPEVTSIAPGLARHMYETNRRVVMTDSLPPSAKDEVKAILQKAANSPPSEKLSNIASSSRSCSQSLRGRCK